MNDIKLPIHMQNDVSLYNYYTYRLAILLSEPKLNHWYMQHFINAAVWGQGAIQVDYLEGYANFAEEYLKTIRLDYTICRAIQHIGEQIIAQLLAGRYAYIYVDQYYIPGSAAFNKNHFFHDLLIYGYESDRKIFHYIIFNADKGLINDYISIDVMEKSFFHGEELNKIEPFPLQFCQIRQLDNEYKFSIRKFIRDLGDYLNGSISAEYMYPITGNYMEVGSFVFGVSSIVAIAKALEKTSEECDLLDYRAFHMLYEHKKGLYARLMFVSKRYGYYSEALARYENLVHQWNMIRNRYIKLSLKEGNQRFYSPPRKKEHIQSLTTQMRDLYHTETNLLGQILKELHKKYIVGNPLPRIDISSAAEKEILHQDNITRFIYNFKLPMKLSSATIYANGVSHLSGRINLGNGNVIEFQYHEQMNCLQAFFQDTTCLNVEITLYSNTNWIGANEDENIYIHLYTSPVSKDTIINIHASPHIGYPGFATFGLLDSDLSQGFNADPFSPSEFYFDIQFDHDRLVNAVVIKQLFDFDCIQSFRLYYSNDDINYVLLYEQNNPLGIWPKIIYFETVLIRQLRLYIPVTSPDFLGRQYLALDVFAAYYIE